MREKQRQGSTRLEDRHSPNSHVKQRHLNRLKKKKQEIVMNSGFTFYFDSRGVCCYRKKRRVI